MEPDDERDSAPFKWRDLYDDIAMFLWVAMWTLIGGLFGNLIYAIVRAIFGGP